MELLGRREARPLHGHGGGEAEDDAEAAEHAEDGQVPGVAEAAVLQTRRHADTQLAEDTAAAPAAAPAAEPAAEPSRKRLLVRSRTNPPQRFCSDLFSLYANL